MQPISYQLSQPSDTHQLQQMVQGTSFTSIEFNRVASPIFLAHQCGNIVGFAYGQKGYGDQSHVLIIQGTYLRHHIDDAQHENELLVAFINWAEQNCKVTHYKIGEFDQPKQIGISYIIPPPLSQNLPYEDDLPLMNNNQYPETNYAYS